MYQLMTTFRAYLLEENPAIPVQFGCDWDVVGSCPSMNDCCAQIVMKDMHTEVLQTDELCLDMKFETALEPLAIGDFMYKIKCNGFKTDEWTAFAKSGASDLVIMSLGSILTLISSVAV